MSKRTGAPTPWKFGVSLFGIVLLLLGTSIVTIGALGTTSVSTPMWVLAAATGLSFGTWTFIVNSGFIIAQWLILRGDFPKTGWLQFPALLTGSVALDVGMSIFAWMATDNYLLKLLTVILGITVSGFGISLMAAANVLYMPGEGMVATCVLPRSESVVRLIGKCYSQVGK